ncbi:MAG: protein-disulfide reductase DsbD [Cycloclasticus sp.]|nr:protein-disulfide reductase DsbD [Cycloclasticus sp.]MBQ0789933.1 protein-disulfide reductase DsbD [Cycloclasticus sp.]
MNTALLKRLIILLGLCLLATANIASSNEKTLLGDSIDALGGLFSSSKQGVGNQLLEPDQAFSFTAHINEQQDISLNWRVADGYYLYQDKIKLTPISPKDLVLRAINFPAGIEKHDEIFGDTLVYYGDVTVIQALADPITEPREISLQVSFQGCADMGVCYPPMSKTISLLVSPGSNTDDKSIPQNKSPYLSEQDQISNALFNDALWLTCLTFFGFGLLLSLTPCVFPMIPILSGIIIGHGKALTSRKAFYLSFSYVLASAATYAAFGVLAGIFGSNLQATFQNPWILTTFSVIFILLALSMFGLYNIQLPASIQSKLSQLSQHQKHGSLWGSAAMGILSTLIVGPCVAAPLAGVLIYIGQTGDATLGGLALFSLGLGMGVPLLLIGISAGKLLPKAGHWMEPIKYFFGILLLAVAIWLMERVLPATVILFLWASLLIICAIYLKATDRLPDGASGWLKFSKGIGTVLLLYGVVLLLGATSGGTNPLKPLANFSVSQGSAKPHSVLSFQTIRSLEELNTQLQVAANNKQRVMLDFYADWCVSCKELEAYTFSDPSVADALNNTMLLQADVTLNNDNDKTLLKRFSLIGPPAILFFNTDSTEIEQARVVGYMPADDFLKRLNSLP